MRQSVSIAAALALLLGSSSILHAEAPAQKQPQRSLFDPARHMRVAEVQPGMRGYGLSVFQGTKIERFDVQVISILRNFSPKQDVVLIRASGCNLEHTGAIAGMSGSPIYLQDEQGRFRMIGAFAFGWPMMKDPLAGVQPIEYMLSIPLYEEAARDTAAPAQATPTGSGTGWSVTDALASARRQLLAGPGQTIGILGRNEITSVGGLDVTQLRPLQTPLMTSGLSSQLMQKISPAFSSLGAVMLQAGSGPAVQPTTQAAGVPVRFEPGSVLAVPLLTGDVDMTAVGTCTEVLGDSVYGFGHPFTGEGPVRLPLGSGSIQGVIANLMTSFKLGSMSQPAGTLLADHVSGVAGRTGGTPPTAPITFKVHFTDDNVDRVYHFSAVIHPKFTPLLAGVSLAGALGASRELPAQNTVDYDITVSFGDGHTLHLADRAADLDPQSLMFGLTIPLMAVADNPFQRALPTRVDGSLTVSAGTRVAEIVDAQTPLSRYRPGDRVKVFVTLRPFRGAQTIQPVEIDIPHDVPDGSYRLSVSGKEQFLAQLASLEPFRATALNIEDVFAILNQSTQVRSNALHACLSLQPEGLALGRAPMPRLPASMRHILTNTGRPDVTAYTTSRTSSVPADMVIQGQAELTIEVDRKARADTAPRHHPAIPPRVGEPADRHTPAAPPPAQTPSDD